MKKTFKQFFNEMIVIQTGVDYDNPIPKKVKPKEHPMVKKNKDKDSK